ncbi:MAG TPA: hypothetical protein VMB02_06585 [Candidatus Aquilonibacter sp.]|nr:hypothetical protein [Candidatus Aquilonibacter sp.]
MRINDAGEIAGYFIDANGAGHGFIRNSSGLVTTIDAPGAGTAQGLGTVVEGLNASGETAGYFIDSQDLEHSFVRNANGAITTFDPAGTSGAQSIGDDGTVAGGYVDENGAHGYLRAPDGTFATFDPTGDAGQVTIVVPNQINLQGSVAGEYTDTNGVFHGFLRDSSGNITVLDAPGAGTSTGEGTEIADMNAGGVMVGGINIGVINGVGTTHSLIRSATGTYSIFDPPSADGVSSFAEGINESGAIIGTYRDATLVRHGFLEEPGGTFVTFDEPNAAQLPLSGVNLGTAALRINASGTVVGLFSDSSGVRHGFIWQ